MLENLDAHYILEPPLFEKELEAFIMGARPIKLFIEFIHPTRGGRMCLPLSIKEPAPGASTKSAMVPCVGRQIGTTLMQTWDMQVILVAFGQPLPNPVRMVYHTNLSFDDGPPVHGKIWLPYATKMALGWKRHFPNPP